VAEATNQRYNQQQNTKKRASFSMDMLSNIADFIVLLFIAWIFSILTEWLGMFFIWTGQGALHSENMLITELTYLNTDFKHTIFGYTPIQFAIWLAGEIDYLLFEATYFRDVIAWSMTPSADAGNFHIGLSKVITFIHEYIAASINTTQVFGVRLAIAILSTPAFMLIGLATLIDGLVKRELRREGGDNESSFIYHNIKPWVRPVIIGAWFIYLGMPVSLHPNIIFIPAALMFGISIYITSSMFKKFL